MTDTRSDRKKQTAVRAVRLIVLVVILLFSTAIGLLHQYGRTWVPVGVDALCPFGGIESAWALVTAGELLPRIALSSFILLGALVLVAVFFRRSFCGNICPLGTLQELAARLGRLVFKKRFIVPEKIDRPLRWLKYVVLAAVAALSWVTATLVIRPVDPWAAYHHLTGADLFTEFTGGFIVLAASLALSLFFDRVFCKYLCPMGAFLGLVSKVGLTRVTRNKATCIDCLACDRVCPVNIKVQSLAAVTTAECLHCSECVNVCPVAHTLQYEWPGKRKRRIAPLVMLVLTFVVYGTVVGSTTLTGSFKWGETTIAESVKLTGAFDPDAITGRSTFEEISVLAGIPREAFVERFQITEAEWSAPMRDAVHKEGATFTMDDVKAFVRERLAGGSEKP